MENITQLMKDDHKKCDDLFAEVESDVVDKKWEEAGAKFDQFKSAMDVHLSSEEEILFPEFEKKTGSSHGPTSMMKMEHEQMRTVMNQIHAAFSAKTYDNLAGSLETLMILLQQHNMKEEQMLYPMADQVLKDEATEMLTRLQDKIQQ